MQPDQTPKPNAFNKNQVFINLGVAAIRGAVTLGIVFLFKKSFDRIVESDKRLEFVPGQNGRLLVEEHHIGNGMERQIKVRYATKEEVWAYSKELMDERLNEMKLI